MLPMILAPFLLFLVYAHQYGDFFAYFPSGDNIHLTGAPFASVWPSDVGFDWAESTLWLHLLNATGVVLLWRQGRRDLTLFAGAYLLPLVFVAHHDLSRYMLPVFPFTLIAFERLLTTREFKLAFLFILPALYIYTWSGLQTNLAPADQMKTLLDLSSSGDILTALPLHWNNAPSPLHPRRSQRQARMARSPVRRGRLHPRRPRQSASTPPRAAP